MKKIVSATVGAITVLMLCIAPLKAQGTNTHAAQGNGRAAPSKRICTLSAQAWTLIQDNHLTEAKNKLNQALAIVPPGRKGERDVLYLMVAAIDMNQGRCTKALGIVKKQGYVFMSSLRNSIPKNIHRDLIWYDTLFATIRGSCYHDLGRWNASKKYFLILKRLVPNNFTLSDAMELADDYMATGRKGAVMRRVYDGSVIVSASDQTQQNYQKAQEYYQRAELGARRLRSQVKSKGEQSAIESMEDQARYNLVITNFKTGHIAEALRWFKLLLGATARPEHFVAMMRNDPDYRPILKMARFRAALNALPLLRKHPTNPDRLPIARSQKNGHAFHTAGAMSLKKARWLAYAAARGKGTALGRLRKAALAGDPVAEDALAYFYFRTKKQHTVAVYWWKKAVERQCVDAEDNLGFAYYRGWGVLPSYKKAMYWWRQAAAHGNAKGECALGAAYADGYAVARDRRKAAHWYKKAAQGGYPYAEYALGLAYENGLGVPESHAKATYWWKQAAEQGYGDAQYNLGVAYLAGQGVHRNRMLAAKWFLVAKANKCPGAAQAVDSMRKRISPTRMAWAEGLAQAWEVTHQ